MRTGFDKNALWLGFHCDDPIGGEGHDHMDSGAFVLDAMGERVDVPEVEYIYNPQNDEKKHFDNVKRWYEAHPDGPHVYSEWSSIPDDPVTREKWFYYLDLYRPMVTKGSRVYMDIAESTMFYGVLPEGVHATLYVNGEIYLCVSNLSRERKDIVLTEAWRDRENGEAVQAFSLGYGEIRFLVKNA